VRKWLDRNSINLDISNKCTIECPKCIRNIFSNKKDIPGHYMTNNEWYNYLNHFDNFVFSGQISDPILHPSFDKILNDVYKSNKKCSVHVASSHKPSKWFEKCFKANPNAKWIFGIDGLPKDSHKYRINQDGEKLFDMMLLSKAFVKETVWQYIVFKYNENNIKEANEIARKNNITFLPLITSRFTEDDPYKPSPEYRMNRNDWRKKVES